MQRKEYTLLLAIFVLAVFFRFFQLASVPAGLYPDEAMNGNNALEALSADSPMSGFKVFYPENNGREGLFINIQALSVKAFGNKTWALRVVSALFGSLAVLGIYFMAKELFRERKSGNSMALLSAFFLATSFWHINFSRLGFRAIMLPFAASFGMYFLFKGLRRKNFLDLAWAGVFFGAGLQTYLAFRFMPLVAVVPILTYFWPWLKNHGENQRIFKGILWFLLVTFIVALPIGLYFLKNPQDFFGRTGQVSIFASPHPLKEFLITNVATLGMFFVRGDCNWRHNFACQPELNPIVAFFFLIGLAALIKNLFKVKAFSKMTSKTLLTWLVFMSLPATLSREGLPHALRSIGLIPPVFILSGFGGWRFLEWLQDWFSRQENKWPDLASQIRRIKKQMGVLFILLILTIPVLTYRQYFRLWASHPETYFAFDTDTWHLGEYLDVLPDSMHKYVVVNRSGLEVRGIPMPSQNIMFATNTFVEKNRELRNFDYILPSQINKMVILEDEKVVVAFLNGGDIPLINAVQKKFPALQKRVPGDFVVLQNY